MADALNTPVAAASPGANIGPPRGNFVEWSAVIAGGVLATAISFVLLAFGAAIGLSATSPWQSRWLSPTVIAALAILWALSQQIGAAMAGGYVAGRMRARWAEAEENEVDFRDGLHGGLVWALSVLISAYVVTSTAGSIARTAAEVAGRAASNPAVAEPIARQVDLLLRASPGRPAGAGSNTSEIRTEIATSFARAISAGALNETDRTYLASVIAERSGVARDEAEKRVQAAFNEASRATKDAADKARRAGVLAGFVTAVGLLISLAAGWWAAIKGGNHRDNAVPARFGLHRRT